MSQFQNGVLKNIPVSPGGLREVPWSIARYKIDSSIVRICGSAVVFSIYILVLSSSQQAAVYKPLPAFDQDDSCSANVSKTSATSSPMVGGRCVEVINQWIMRQRL